MQTIDYAKYSNMSERQLLNSLLNAEKREQKLKADLQEKIKATSDLISFLKTKLKEQIDKPRYSFVDYEKSESHKLANVYMATLSDQEKNELRKEVLAEVEADYGNEL